MDVYEAIFRRRDVRSFRPDPVPDSAIVKILEAAHHAGSVGFMQPWNFIVIRSAAKKALMHQIFVQENEAASQHFSGARGELYRSIKLEGILDAPINIAVTCDRERGGPHVLGRNSVYDTDVYSTCCAVQNLWLAARAEGLGVGWVSILDNEAVKMHLGIPATVLLIAYLCVGYPVSFGEQPLLQELGWAKRSNLGDMVFEEGWLGPSTLPLLAPKEPGG